MTDLTALSRGKMDVFVCRTPHFVQRNARISGVGPLCVPCIDNRKRKSGRSVGFADRAYTPKIPKTVHSPYMEDSSCFHCYPQIHFSYVILENLATLDDEVCGELQAVLEKY
jgi:hypothetical protein